MKKIVISIFVLLAQAVIGSTPAEDVQVKLNSIQKMTANFNQVVKAGAREVSNSSGVMALYRPGRFRWDTKEPMAQLVVADGNKLWVYDIDLEQVTVNKQEKGIGGTPGLFLSGYDNTVARDFTVMKKKEGASETFELHAKSTKENYQQVKLTFKGDKLTKLEFFDQLGQHTTVNLNNIKNDPQFSTKLFQFKAPKGVDIVSQ